MMRLIYSDPALTDFEGIMDHIGRENPAAAVRFGKGLLKTADSLESHSEMGVRCEDIAEGMRLFSFRGYRLYYRIDTANQTALHERVLHPSLDVGPQTFE